MEAPEFGDQIRGCQQLGNKSGVCYKGAAQRDFEAAEAVLYPDDGRGYSNLYLLM